MHEPHGEHSYKDSFARAMSVPAWAAPLVAIGVISLIALVSKLVQYRRHCCRPKSVKLTYFLYPGRAEAIRVALAIGGVKFEDERLSVEDWKKHDKSCTPYGQLPVLYADGQPLAQSLAILAYASTIAGLHKCCNTPLTYAKVYEIVFLVDEIFDALKPTYSMSHDEQISARKALMGEGGAIARVWGHIEKRLERNAKEHKYVVTHMVTAADVCVFCMAAMLSSGWLNGIDKDFLKNYPHVRAHKAMVAQMPRVREFYGHLPQQTKAAWQQAGIDIKAYQQ
ncbi:hypothetical protein KFE25_011162 [Diacronema lutheri]|uniref:Glutathione S-transferase n=1 Tax=Diacronema lutheri TaxID=2081491 RepID=A0A8J5XPN6_DIALT|nr:hypothetical protein KFE25_011162 [Diacronema lutheri]